MFQDILVCLAKVDKKFYARAPKISNIANCTSAFEGKISTEIIVNLEHHDLEEFLREAESMVLSFLSEKLVRYPIKVYCMLTAIFEVREEEQTMYLYTSSHELYQSSDLQRWYHQHVVEVLLNRLSTFELGPSDLALSELVSLAIYTQKNQSIRVGKWLPLPTHLASRTALLNIKNQDDFCLLHCINAFVNPVEKDGQRVCKYPPLADLQLNLKDHLSHQNFEL